MKLMERLTEDQMRAFVADLQAISEKHGIVIDTDGINEDCYLIPLVEGEYRRIEDRVFYFYREDEL